MKQDKRTLAELVKAYLSEESAAEFDRIVRESKPRRSRLLIWGSMLAAAASLALLLTLALSESRCEFNGIEIAEGIQQIMNLNTDEVKSVIATPEGSRVILTASMKDGSQCSYVMSRNNGTEAVSITAMK